MNIFQTQKRLTTGSFERTCNPSMVQHNQRPAKQLYLKQLNHHESSLQANFGITIQLRHLLGIIKSFFLIFPFCCNYSYAAISIDTISSWDGTTAVQPFGYPDTATYGQTITVDSGSSPLNSFTFKIGNCVNNVNYRGYVYAWDGQKATGAALYRSDVQSSNSSDPLDTSVTLTVPALSLPAGQYVLFVSISEIGSQNNSSCRFGYYNSDVYPGGNFVYQNNGLDFANLSISSWDFFGGDLAFQVDGLNPILPATITASSQTATYGTAATAISYSVDPTGITFDTTPTCAAYNTSDTAFTSPIPLNATTAAGTYVTHCKDAVASGYAFTYIDGILTINQASTSIEYTGDNYFAKTPIALKAQLSSGVPACKSSQIVNFSYSTDSGTTWTPAGSSSTSGAGVATLNWTPPPGFSMADIKVAFPGSPNCATSNSNGEDVIVLANGGFSSFGSGSYITKDGSVKFGYFSLNGPAKGMPSTFGQVFWHLAKKTRLEGRLTGFGKIPCPTQTPSLGVSTCGLMTGKAKILSWNAGTRNWDVTQVDANFQALIADGGTRLGFLPNPDFFRMNLLDLNIPGETESLIKLKSGNIVIR